MQKACILVQYIIRMCSSPNGLWHGVKKSQHPRPLTTNAFRRPLSDNRGSRARRTTTANASENGGGKCTEGCASQLLSTSFHNIQSNGFCPGCSRLRDLALSRPQPDGAIKHHIMRSDRPSSRPLRNLRCDNLRFDFFLIFFLSTAFQCSLFT